MAVLGKQSSFEIVTGIIDIRAMTDTVATEADGAIATFSGIVRGTNRGKKVFDGPLAEVKAGAGASGIQLDYDGDGSILPRLPGVRRVNDAGKSAEIFLEDGADPQALLRALIDNLTVRRFDLREPSLHEIFVRAVGGKSDE